MENLVTLKYKIIPEYGLIIDCWFGELTFEKILEAKLKQANDESWNRTYSNISDIRNVVFKLSDEEAQKIISYTKQDERWQEKRKTAYLTNNPNQVVFQKLIDYHKAPEIPYKIESFSTLNNLL